MHGDPFRSNNIDDDVLRQKKSGAVVDTPCARNSRRGSVWYCNITNKGFHALTESILSLHQLAWYDSIFILNHALNVLKHSIAVLSFQHESRKILRSRPSCAIWPRTETCRHLQQTGNEQKRK